MVATTPATTNQNQSGVAKRSRSSEQPDRVRQRVAQEPKKFAPDVGLEVVRVASGTAPA